MKFLRAAVLTALVFAFAVPAFAETQNVKVSGGLDAYWFHRDQYNLSSHAGSESTVSHSSDAPSGDDYFRSNTQIEVSADLTDNVSTVINLVNQRDWNSTMSAPITPAEVSSNEFNIDLDLAYVQMKEIFYSPLTLTVGRQDLWFGRGFIIGNNNVAWDPNGIVAAKEYSVTTAFDAIRATLDFNPWTIDFVYAKIFEGNQNLNNDIDLYITNINYKFADYNAVAEAYWVTQWDRSLVNSAAGLKASDTETLGGRVQFDPISQISLGGELAYQFGDYQSTAVIDKERGAWAADLFGTYRFDNTWKPEVTVEYVYFSGESDLSNGKGSYGSWNGLYRGKFWTAYEDFREFIYTTTQAGDTPATQNSEMIQVKGAIKPLEDMLLEGSWSHFWSPESEWTGGAPNVGTKLGNTIGNEFDAQITYDYTEDVSFGFLAAWFIPGNKFQSPNDKNATDFVASTKVTF